MRLSPQIVERASRPFSSSPRPFLKWAGLKRFLLTQIVAHLPTKFARYYEPFLGSGSLFFAIAPNRATLGDTCQDLINTYLAVRDNSQRVMGYLRAWKPDEDFYYQVCNQPSHGRFKRAAEFIYLNKTCWNGLYRVNLEGRFNVPYGRPKTNNLIGSKELAAAATALARHGVSIRKADFEETLDSAGEGDLVYLDPPYVTGHNGNGLAVSTPPKKEFP